MKRPPLPRRTKPIARSTKRIRSRGRSRFPNRRNPEYLAAIRGMPCLLTGLYDLVTGKQHVCDGPIEAAHVKSRGAGGSDEGNTIPLDRAAHRQQHQMGFLSWHDRWFLTRGTVEHYAKDVYPKQVAKRLDLGWPE